MADVLQKIAFQYKYADKVLDFQKRESFLNTIPLFLAYGGDEMNKSWETDTFNFLKEHHASYGFF